MTWTYILYKTLGALATPPGIFIFLTFSGALFFLKGKNLSAHGASALRFFCCSCLFLSISSLFLGVSGLFFRRSRNLFRSIFLRLGDKA